MKANPKPNPWIMPAITIAIMGFICWFVWANRPNNETRYCYRLPDIVTDSVSITGITVCGTDAQLHAIQRGESVPYKTRVSDMQHRLYYIVDGDTLGYVDPIDTIVANRIRNKAKTAAYSPFYYSVDYLPGMKDTTQLVILGNGVYSNIK